MLFSDVRRDYVNILLRPLSGKEAENIEYHYKNMEQKGTRELRKKVFIPVKFIFCARLIYVITASPSSLPWKFLRNLYHLMTWPL